MISLLFPVFNEEKTIPELFRRLRDIAGFPESFEILFVDDGSLDATAQLILEYAAKFGWDSQVKLISFSRNFGHQIALSAGLDHVSGDAVVILDADLQDPPELIPEFLFKWNAGAQIVYAVRKHRKESWHKRLCYASFYRLLGIIANISIPLDSGDFCLLDRAVVDVIRSMPEHNRFLRGMRAWSGFRSEFIEYDRAERFAGETKYSFRKLLHLAFDGIVGFSTTPLTISMYLGLFASMVSFVVGVLLFIFKLWKGFPIQGWTSLMITMFFIGGVQLFVLGIIGEYIARIYIETQNRPLYIIKRKNY